MQKEWVGGIDLEAEAKRSGFRDFCPFCGGEGLLQMINCSRSRAFEHRHSSTLRPARRRAGNLCHTEHIFHRNPASSSYVGEQSGGVIRRIVSIRYCERSEKVSIMLRTFGRFEAAMRHGIMSCASLLRLSVATACLGLAGCATVQTENRARIIDLPLASAHADIAFTMTTGSRWDAATRFALQVQRVTGVLQRGAESLYPDLAQRLPGLVGSHFDVYVVDGDEPGSASSANGRIALNAGLGAQNPYDDWLAFVIAREMGHVIARHHEENSAAGIVTSVIMNILIPGSSLLKSLMSAGGAKVAAKSQRDVQALEADAIALDLLQAAGFLLRDISLTLLIEPVPLDRGPWSKRFRESSDHLQAEARRLELAFVTTR